MSLKRKVSSSTSTATHPFDTGYVVYKNAIPKSSRYVKSLNRVVRSPKLHSIFNHTGFDEEADIGKKRRQAFLTDTLAKKLLGEFQKDNFPNLILSDSVALLSLEDCPQQLFHVDYVVTDELLALPREDFPLGMILAVEDGTKLLVREGAYGNNYNSSDANVKEVHLDAGDVLVFRADQVHAGAAYSERNLRVHGFLDSKVYSRPENETFIMLHQPTD